MNKKLIPIPTNIPSAHPAKLAKRWVVKVGSSLLTQNGLGLDPAFIQQLVVQIHQLMQLNIEVILVTSGAIAQGIGQFKWETRPKDTASLQAAAAVGQMGLVQMYQDAARHYGLICAQLLLTHDDLSHRERYLNARATMYKLLELNALPIINENDSVITTEIKFGDNDNLAALVGNLMDADLLCLLTDQKGIYTANPQLDPKAQLIEYAQAQDPYLLQCAGGSGSRVGTGGMSSKVIAAKRAAQSGMHTVIANGREPDVLLRLQKGENLGSLLLGMEQKIPARKQWMLDHLQLSGQLLLDEGAYKALQQGSSLLPIGVVDVLGEFQRGDVVACCYQNQEVARGISQYDSSQARQIIQKNSEEVADILGEISVQELIHRNDLVMMNT